MSIVVVTKSNWKIPKGELKAYDKTEIEGILHSFNQSCSGVYYMLDYYHEKIILDSLAASVLCGYPKETIEKYGFDFFKKILNPDEQNWLDRVNTAGYRFLFNYPEKGRKDLVISYDLTVRTVNGISYPLHHKISPFKFDRNANMWLGLCYVTESSSKEMKHTASILDTLLGKKYNFDNDEFKLSDTEILSYREKQILMLMTKDLTRDQICENMRISRTALNRGTRKMFDKLGVDKIAGAIRKAHIDGII
jgi:DNA-binding CsgD family transcriptional regulator